MDYYDDFSASKAPVVAPSATQPRKGPIEAAAEASPEAPPSMGYVESLSKAAGAVGRVLTYPTRLAGRALGVPSYSAPAEAPAAAPAAQQPAVITNYGSDGADAMSQSVPAVQGQLPTGPGSVAIPQPKPVIVPPAGIARGATNPAPVIGNAVPSTYNPVATQAALDAYAARERQGVQDATNAMQQNANWGAAWQAQQRAQGAARVANWNAEMARLDEAGNIGGPGRDEAARLAAAGAAGANERLKATDAAVAAASQPSARNYVDEYGKLQKGQAEAVTAGALATTAASRLQEAGARGELERAQAKGFQLTNEQHQKLLALSAAMGAAQSPEEIQKIERQMLALGGKSPDEYGIMHAQGGSYPDPNNPMMQIKVPDRVWVYSKRNPNDVHELTSGAGARGTPPSQKEIDFLKKNKGNAAVIKQFETANPGYKASDFNG